MFLRRYQRTKDGKTHTYYALVESIRTESGPRQHTVAYLVGNERVSGVLPEWHEVKPELVG